MRLLREYLSNSAVQAGLALAFFAHAADIISTLVAMHIPNIVEANPLMRDPETLKFLLLPGLGIKALAMISAIIPSIFLWWGCREDKWPAMLPFVLSALPTLDVALHNMLLFWKLS